MRTESKHSRTYPQPSAPSMGTITELVVLYHDLSVSTDSVGGCRQDLDDTHIQTHTLLPPLVYCYIRQLGRESGSSNRAIRTPRDPIDLLIDPLLPLLVQTTARVYTATTGKCSGTLQARAHVTPKDGRGKSGKRAT